MAIAIPPIPTQEEIIFLDPDYGLLDVQTFDLNNRPAIEVHAVQLAREYNAPTINIAVFVRAISHDNNPLNTSSTSQFLQILFPDAIQSGDLDILAEATREQPGRIKLQFAWIGETQSGAPNSKPVYSGRGGKIGFVAEMDLAEPPFDQVYLLVETDEDEAKQDKNQGTIPFLGEPVAPPTAISQASFYGLQPPF